MMSDTRKVTGRWGKQQRIFGITNVTATKWRSKLLAVKQIDFQYVKE
jgi:hypothetical protein